MRDAKLRQAPQRDGEYKKQINDGRHERENNLEKENIWNRDPSKRAIARLAYRVAMLPHGLQSAKGPAEPLANQSFHSVGNFGAPDGFFVVKNFPTVPADSKG